MLWERGRVIRVDNKKNLSRRVLDMATGLGRSEKNTEAGSSIPLARSRWTVESAGEALTRPAVEAIKEAESQSYWNDHQSVETFNRSILYQLTDKDWDVFRNREGKINHCWGNISKLGFDFGGAGHK
jgi:hypothetical protein